MAKNADLRKLLQDKLGIKRAQVYRYANDLANSLSISVSDAIYLLAAKNHINLKKYTNLSDEKLGEIRKLIPAATAVPVPQAESAPKSASSRGRRAKKGFKKIKVTKENDPVLKESTRTELEAMVSVYKTLYLLENSIRQFITRVLTAVHGPDWWDKAAPRGLRDTVDKRRKEESVNAWHQRRSTNPIDYLDLDQLPALVRNTQSAFVPTFFKSPEWFQHFADEVYQSRCVVCHMNPLTQTNADGVGLRFNHWEQLVKTKLPELEALENPQPQVAVAAPVVAAVPAQPAVATAVPVEPPAAATEPQVSE